MGDESSDAMNLDLNLGLGPEPFAGSMDSEVSDLNGWFRERFYRNSQLERRRRYRRRFRHHHHGLHEAPFRDIPAETLEGHFHSPENMSMELNHSMVNPGSAVQAGEGSAVAGEERALEVPKACDMNNCGVTLDEKSEKEENVENGGGNDGEGFFNCNICFDLARDPVVTCCGHLFCWPCLYKWLYLHSHANECPVCKGEVTDKNVTPIYGRGNDVRVPDEDSTLKIPPRPSAIRHGSEDSTLRQTSQGNAHALPVEQMIRRLRTGLFLGQDIVQLNDHNNARETAERTSSLLSRFATIGRVGREYNLVPARRNVSVAGLSQNSVDGPLLDGNRRYQSILTRRPPREGFESTLSSTRRLFEEYFQRDPLGTNQEQPPPVEDRDSFSSIGAVIRSENQVDTAVEIDSRMSLSASSSGTRNHTSRVSEVDSGESRAQRRRRLN